MESGDVMFDGIMIKDILSVLNIYSKKKSTQERVERNSYGISFCKSGKITYFYNGQKCVSDETCVVVHPKNTNYTLLRQETGSFPVINFDCENFYTDKFLTIPISNPQILFKLFNELSEHFYYNETLEAKSVLYKILAEIEKNNKDSNTSRAVNYIHKNFSDPLLTNKKIADHLKISETYLNKQFLKNNGITPKKFVQKTRMENAVKLLSEGNNSMGEIAEMCGFTSIYSFSRAFKSYTGKSPTEYKKELWMKII